jgi:N-terminal half of MaoC dehydratase
MTAHEVGADKAFRGAYNKYEEEMIARFQRFAGALEGYDADPTGKHVTRESIKGFSEWADRWNILWHSEEYAKKTRWGGLIAYPLYPDNVGGIVFFPELDRASGRFVYHDFLGEDWSNLGIVRPGDVLTVYRRRPTLTDTTPDEGGERRFAEIFDDADVINQDDRVIATRKMLAIIKVSDTHPREARARVKALPYKDHAYTKEEMDYLQDIMDKEEIRGAKVRCWQDVNVGDELTPCTLGPSTVWDMVSFAAARRSFPMLPTRAYRESPGLGALTLDPETGVVHTAQEWHFIKSMAEVFPEPQAFVYATSSRTQISRLVTNWMGDDGQITAMKFRHLNRSPLGDTLVARGRVVNKRVEDGKCLVDIDGYTDNLCQGFVSDACLTTVSLPPRIENSPAGELSELAAPRRSAGREDRTPSDFEVGDRVRFKGRKGCFPTGDPLAGAEGEIAMMYPWADVYEDFSNYVAVRITKEAAKPYGWGSGPYVRTETLEKI